MTLLIQRAMSVQPVRITGCRTSKTRFAGRRSRLYRPAKRRYSTAYRVSRKLAGPRRSEFDSMISSLEQVAQTRLNRWSEDGFWRSPSVFASAQTPRASLQSAGDNHFHKAILFSSSNYLGLSEHPDIANAVKQATDIYGFGSGGSRLTTGSGRLHLEAEAAVARFTGYPDAVLFVTVTRPIFPSCKR